MIFSPKIWLTQFSLESKLLEIALMLHLVIVADRRGRDLKETAAQKSRIALSQRIAVIDWK